MLDDSPKKRYGKHIEGANDHHNPTPGKTDAKFCYGHSWVVAALIVAHLMFGEIFFPIAAELYLRQKESVNGMKLPLAFFAFFAGTLCLCG